MTTQVLTTPQMAFQSGVFAPGAKLYVYLTGTTTPVTVYSDEDFSTAHSSPVVADGSGVFPAVYSNASSALKVVITAADDSAIATIDPAPKVSSTGSSASAISFDAVDGNAADDVQEAIANNTSARENRSGDVKTFLEAADVGEMRDDLGLGDVATEDMPNDGNLNNNGSAPCRRDNAKSYADSVVAAAAPAYSIIGMGTVTDGTSGGFTVEREDEFTITRTGTGTYDCTWGTARANATYIPIPQCTSDNRLARVSARSTTAFTIETSVGGNFTNSDEPFTVVVFD